MTKLDQFTELARQSSQSLWQDKEYYLSFLRTAAQMYKYEFQDQLLIHAQNPNATACAEYDFWNDENKMNRFIKRGSKGIALLDRSGERPRLRYVYDVAQTGRRDERSKDPYLWEATENNRQMIIDVLGSNAEHLDTAILEKAHELAQEHADDYTDMLYNGYAENTFLEELDELNTRTDFAEVLENSIAYAMLSRCGYDPDLYFDDYDFSKLYEFNSISAMSILGTAVSDITEVALRSIERVIKAERSIENERSSITQDNDGERNQLHSGRGNGDISSRPQAVRSGGTADRKVRTNAADISEGTSQSDISSDVSGGNTVPTSERSGRSSSQTIENNVQQTEAEFGRDGTAEGRRPDEVGGLDEQHSENSGRSNSERADLRLNNDEQAVPDGAAFPVSEETVLGIINHYDEMNVTKQEVLEIFLESDDNNRRAEFMKAAYGHRAVEFELDGVPVGYKKYGDGLEIWENAPENNVKLSWDTVQELTASLIDRHEFIEAPEYFDIEPAIEVAGGYDEMRQLSLFDDDIDLPEPTSPTRMTAQAVTSEMIDDFLRTGSKENNSLERIVAEFQIDKSVPERADFLRKEFGTNAVGLNYISTDETEQAKIAVQYNNNGFVIGIGNKANNNTSVSVSWEQAAERISELLQSGEFCSQEIIDCAHSNSIKELSEKLWYLHQDVEVEYFIPKHFFTGGFDVSTSKIAEALQGEKPVQEMIDGMTDLIKQYEADRDVLRFHFHNLPAMLQSLKDLQLERTEFKAKEGYYFTPDVFITEDEKDIVLSNNAFWFKNDVSEFFKQPHTDKEKSDYLKNKYGIGGSSVSGGHTSYDSKGFIYERGQYGNPTASVKMSWSDVAKRVERLIDEDKYISREEIDKEISRARKVVDNPDTHLDSDVEYCERFLRSQGAMPQKTVTITCDWSESNVFEAGKTYTVAEFDRIMEEADRERHEGWHNGLAKYGSQDAWRDEDKEGYFKYLGYDKTGFTVNLPNGDSITERQDIGDGIGGVIDLFRSISDLQQYVPMLEAQRDMDNLIRERDELQAIHDEMEKERAEYIVPVTADELIERFLHADSNRHLDSYEIAGMVFQDSAGTSFDPVQFFDKFHSDKYSEAQAEEIRSIITQAVASREHSDLNVSENAEISNADILHNAFDKLIEGHSFSDEAVKFLRRTETFMEHNGYTELDPKIFKFAIFQQNYGTVSRINDKLFNGEFKEVMNELNSLLSAYTPSITSITEIDSETAVGMISDGGFEVYNKDSVLVDIDYIIDNSEQTFKAAAEDVEVFAKRDEIALKIDDISSAYEFTPHEEGEPFHLDLMRFANNSYYYDWDSFQQGKNVYQNVMIALRDNNLDVLHEYLDEVCNVENGTEFEDMANEVIELLDSYADKYVQKELTDKEEITANAPEKTYSEITKDMYHIEDAEVQIFTKGSFAKIEIQATDELIARLADNSLTPLPSTENIRIIFETDGGNWNKIALPDKFGNMYNNIDIEDILTPSELSTAYEVARFVTGDEYLAWLENSQMANEEAEEIDDSEYQLKVGDKIELDDGRFEITEISDSIDDVKYQLRDLNSIYPIFRVIYETELYEKGFALAEEVPLPEPVRSAPNIANVPEISTASAEKHNYTITDEALGTGGAKTKFKNNVAAIRLLNELEFEKRLATPEEQEVLAKYVGWGGLSQAFDENNSAWAEEFMELYTLLSPDEYESARASTLNAHYTSPTVINAIYEGLSNMGFKGGNVLEPAMGVGNFFGVMPEEMRNSKLYGVELDEISGRIAKQLYQNAKIQVTGFEKTAYPDNFFDVAIGNVPFGQYKLSEKRYDKLNLNIHDHFFAKSLDKVRAGGVVAFVTSKGTLDKANPQFRKYLAQRAELVGAIRLPNTAFKDNAGTEVTSDIIFLQKRDKMVDIEPEWVHLGKTADGVPVNKYFEEHPEMILGEMKQGVEFSLYGNAEETACVAAEGADLKEQLKEAIKNIQGIIPEMEAPDIEDGKTAEALPADPNIQNYSFAVVDDKIYYRENSVMFLQNLPKATEDRIKGMCELRDCVRTLIDYQLNEYSDFEIREQQARLNTLYDDFSKKYGLINSTANERAFRDDNAYHLLSSLEILDEDGKLQRKADMFTKRTIKQRTQVTSVDTASEALAVSIGEKAGIDMPFMQQLTGKTEEQLYNDLKGVIFLNPMHNEDNSSIPKYLTADEYLSGNVREKLHIANMKAVSYPEYAVNVEALTAVQPTPLQAHEIDVRLGATWIEPQYIREFMFELLHTPVYLQYRIDVDFSKYTSEWNISGKSIDKNNVMVDMTYGTARKRAYSIIEDTLNLRDVRVYDRIVDDDGNEKSVLNQKETTLAQQKQEAIKEAFKDWIFKDPERRERLVKQYNEIFNSTRPREYDGSHLTFSGMSPEIQLREHQVNAIAHTIYGGNTLLAHQVGAGKTFEMVASAMESKRLGLCNKSMFVVPNHLTEQMGAEFLRLYPSANILVATKKDFEAKNRKRLCAKIATGDYDAVIIGHSQLEKIPISPEREERMIKNQINEVVTGLRELKSSGRAKDNFSVKQLEKTKKTLEARLRQLIESPKRDNVVTFEQLGIDKLYVDEAHSFKNLYLYTKMRNVAGIQQTEAQKSSDLYMKCQYLDEITGGKGIVFATGTPVSNSMTELYTMMRYLQADKLKKLGMQNFDAWASNFGEAVTAIELAPEGTGYRAKTRFSKFFNLPELMNIFKEAADIKTADMLNLPVPEANFHNVVVQPTDIQCEMVSGLSDRAKQIHNKMVAPEEDNMLKVTNDGRKIGLDQRLIDPLLPDDPNSKVNTCINNVFDIYTKNDDTKATQLIFCDFSTPTKKKTITLQEVGENTFGLLPNQFDNLYDDIRDKLVAKGVPREEIAFIHEADTEVKKKELFAKVRTGQVRVLIGSTAKCGAGTNIQDKLKALHHLDCPWRPSDLEQREGRIIRQGNENPSVDVYRYVTEATFDAYLYQTIENKQRFISQIMTSKSPVRSMEDVDEATLSYAEVKALCAGNPLIKEKMDLDVDVAKLKVAKANHTAQQYNLEDRVRKTLPQSIVRVEQRIEGLKSDLEHFKAQPIVAEGIAPMTVCNTTYTDKEKAGQAIINACKNVKANVDYDLGTYKGFDMTLSYDSFAQEFHLDLQREATHRISLSNSAVGNITRIDNALAAIETKLTQSTEQLAGLREQLETAKGELGKPFPMEQELAEKTARLVELDSLLNLNDTDERDVDVHSADESDVISEAAEKSSVNAKPSVIKQITEIKSEKSPTKSDISAEKKQSNSIDI